MCRSVTPESLLNVLPRVVTAIYYPESTGGISMTLGDRQNLPPDGARAQVCNSLRNINVTDIND